MKTHLDDLRLRKNNKGGGEGVWWLMESPSSRAGSRAGQEHAHGASQLRWELPDSLSGGAHPGAPQAPSQKPLSTCKELEKGEGKGEKKKQNRKTNLKEI